MGLKKGQTNNPNGRPKGSTNKSTEAAKQIVVDFVGKNVEEMQELFDIIKKDDPKKAFDILYAGLEYVIPKLARTENYNESRLTDKDGNDLLKEDLEILRNFGLIQESKND